MKQIKIVIDVEGGVIVEAIGYKGRGCKEATKALESALGAVTKDTDKPELYQSEATVSVGSGTKK